MKKTISKKVIIASVLLIALCLTMLALGTFAWYWDGVLHAKNADVTAAEIGFTFTDLDNGEEGFTVVDWLPGDSRTVNYQVTSGGTISQTLVIRISAVEDDAGLFAEKDEQNFDKNLSNDFYITTIGLNEDVEGVCIKDLEDLYLTVGPLETTTFKVIYEFKDIAGNEQQYAQGDVLNVSITADLQNTTKVATATYANKTFSNLESESDTTKIETADEYLYTANLTVNDWNSTTPAQIAFTLSGEDANSNSVDYANAVLSDVNTLGRFSVETAGATTYSLRSAVQTFDTSNTFDVTRDKTLSLAIFVQGDSAYVFIDGKLQLGFINHISNLEGYDNFITLVVAYADAMISGQRYYDNTTAEYIAYTENATIETVEETHGNKAEKIVYYPTPSSHDTNSYNDMDNGAGKYVEIPTDDMYVYTATVNVNEWNTNGNKSQIGFHFSEQYTNTSKILFIDDNQNGNFAIKSDLDTAAIGDLHTLDLTAKEPFELTLFVNGDSVYAFIRTDLDNPNSKPVLKVAMTNLRSDNPGANQISEFDKVYVAMWYVDATITNQTYYNANSAEYLALENLTSVNALEKAYASNSEKTIINNHPAIITLNYTESSVFGGSKPVKEGTVVTIDGVGDYVVGENGTLEVYGLPTGSTYTYSVAGCKGEYNFTLNAGGVTTEEEVDRNVVVSTSTSTVDVSNAHKGTIVWTNDSLVRIDENDIIFVSFDYTGNRTTTVNSASGAGIYMSTTGEAPWSLGYTLHYNGDDLNLWHMYVNPDANNWERNILNDSYIAGTQVNISLAMAVIDNSVYTLYKTETGAWRVAWIDTGDFGNIAMIGSGSPCEITNLKMLDTLPDVSFTAEVVDVNGNADASLATVTLPNEPLFARDSAITITPKSGYKVRSITVNGLDATSSYTDGVLNYFAIDTVNEIVIKVVPSDTFAVKLNLSYAESAVYGASKAVKAGSTVTIAGVDGSFVTDANGSITVNDLRAGTYTYTVSGCDGSRTFTVTDSDATIYGTLNRTVIASASNESNVNYSDALNGNISFTGTSNLTLADKDMKFVSATYTGSSTTSGSGFYIYMSNDDGASWSMAMLVRYDELVRPNYEKIDCTTDPDTSESLMIWSGYPAGQPITTTIAIALYDGNVNMLFKWGNDEWRVFKTFENTYGKIWMIGSGLTSSISELTMSEEVPNDVKLILGGVVVTEFDIPDLLVYQGYYVKIPTVPEGTPAFTDYTDISIRDGKVYAGDDLTPGTYNVRATIDGYYYDTFTVTVRNPNDAEDDGIKMHYNASNGTAASSNLATVGTTRKNSIDALVYDRDELTLFFGDSFMDEYFFTDFDTRFAGKNAETVGISSSRAEQWIWFIQDLVLPYTPKTIISHIGTNDIFDGLRTPETVIISITTLFDLIHEDLPDTQVWWWTIEDRCGQYAYAGKITTVNNGVSAWASDKDWFHIVDTRSIFISSDSAYGDRTQYDATLWRNNGEDKIHPSLKGYDLFMQATYAAGCPVPTANSYTGGTVTSLSDYTGNSWRGQPLGVTNNFLYSAVFTPGTHSGSWARHFSFNLNNNESDSASFGRFLVFDDTKTNTGAFKYYASIKAGGGDSSIGSDTIPSGTFTIQVLVNSDSAYLYLNGVLRSAMINVTGIVSSAGVGLGEMSGASLTKQKIYSSATTEFKMLNESAQVRALETQYAASTNKSVINISSSNGLSDYQHVNADEDNYMLDWCQNTISGATTDFVYTANITINKAGLNPHVSLSFNKAAATRFLIWDGDKDASGDYAPDGYYTAQTSSNNKTTPNERYEFRGTNNTMSIAVLVIGHNAYLFINDELAVAAICINGTNALTSFTVGMSNMSSSITNQHLYNSSSAEYSTYTSKSEIATYQRQYGNATTAQTYVNINDTE